MKKTLSHFLINQAENSNITGITFIQDGENSVFVSYASLLDISKGMLGGLQKIGLQKGDFLIFFIEDNESFISAFWACLLGGIIPVPISVGGQEQHANKLFAVRERLDNCAILTDDSNKNRVHQFALERKMPLNQNQLFSFDQINGKSYVGDIQNLDASDIAFIQFSSGSTGSPKGVILTHKNLISNVTDISIHSNLEENSTSLSWMPLTHDMGLIGFHLTNLVTGSNQFIMPPSLFIRRPLLWFHKVHEHKASHLYSPNFGLHYFLLSYAKKSNKPAWDLSNLKIIYNGAEPISNDICEKFQEVIIKYRGYPNVIFPCYGMAEASVAVSLPVPGDPLKVYSLDRQHLNFEDQVVFTENQISKVDFVGVGKAIKHTSVRIVNDENVKTRDLQIGNIQIKGANVTSGYINDANKTRKLFTNDGWLKTGDLGFLNKGELVITGRRKNIIIINGQNYYPHDIERSLEKLPEIVTGKIAVVGIKNRKEATQKLVVFVLFKKGLDHFIPLINSIKQHIAQQLGLEAHAVIPLRKIPRTTSGKLQYFELANAYENGSFDPVKKQIDELVLKNIKKYPPQEIEAHLEREYRLLFGAPHRTIEDSFFNLGVSSLQAMVFVNRINTVLNLSLTVKDIFENPSIKALSSYITENPTQEESIEIVAIAKQKFYPLHSTQKKYWAISQLEDKANIALNIPLAFEVDGAIKMEQMEQALCLLIERHESLRTFFELQKGVPVQRILSKEELEFKIVEHSINSDSKRYEKAILKANQLIGRTFDLRNAPLFYADLIHYKPNKSILVFVWHHIIIDGWSLSVFFEELSQVYTNLINGGSKKLNPSPLQFKDFAHWFNQWNGMSKQYDEDYWKQQIDAIEEPLRLPFYENQNSSKLSFDGAETWIQIDNTLTAEIKELASKIHVTPFAVYLSVLRVLCYRYSGQDAITIATEIAGRNFKQLETMLGCATNTALLRTPIKDKHSFSELAKHVMSTSLEAWDHNHFYLDSLFAKENANSEKEFVLSDLYVVYQNFNKSPLLDGIQDHQLQFKSIRLSQETTLANLYLEFIEDPASETTNVNFRYNSNLLKANHADKILKDFIELCKLVISNPNETIDKLYGINSEEFQMIRTLGLGKKRTDNDTSIIQIFEKQLAVNGDRPALNQGKLSISFYELNEKANQVAHFLKIQGVRKGDRIGLISRRSITTTILIIGILKVGGVYVPMDVEYPRERMSFIMKDSQISLLFSELPTNDFSEEKVVQIDSVLELIAPFETTNLKGYANGNQLAYILYTSGTTGTPKGVMISHESLSDYVHTFIDYFSVDAMDIVIHQSSLCFDIHVEELFPALISGSNIIISEHGGRDIPALSKLIEVEKASILSATPMVIEALNRNAESLSSLRVVISGGDKLKKHQVSNLLKTAQVYNTYGPTETTVCATYHQVTSNYKENVIGKPITNKDIYVLNEGNELQVLGGVGEIAIGGKGIARGYINLPKLTQSVFIDNPFGNGKLYKTGDLGRWTKEGTLLFLGRNDKQVKIGGHRIEITEIEHAINEQLAIKNVIVLPLNTNGTVRLVAFYIQKVPIEKEDIFLALRSKLPIYMVPSELVQLESFPMNTNGKIDNDQLISLIDTLKTPSKDIISDEMETTMSAIWRECLNANTFFRYSNFFELGGDSILATHLVLKINEVFKSQIRVIDLFHAPTIAGLTSKVQQNLPNKLGDLVLLDSESNYPISFAQRRMWILDQKETSNTYIMSGCFRIKGVLDLTSLNEAFRNLIVVNESLRTSFKETEDGLKMFVHEPEELKFDISYEETMNLEIAQIEQKTYALFDQKMDLTKAPLMKAFLFKRSANSHILVCTIHHMVSDGISMDIFSKNLLDNYYALVNKQIPKIVIPEIQYKEFAAWQQQYLSSLHGIESKEYWRNELSDSPAILPQLEGYKNPIADENARQGNTIHKKIEKESYASILQLCKAYQTTSFQLFLASTKIALFIYAKSIRNLSVGVTVSGRDFKELEDSIGLYLNTVVIQSRINTQENFVSYLAGIARKMMHATEHQYYPYDKIVNEFYGNESYKENPFYDVLIVHQQKNSEIFLNAYKGDNALRIEPLKWYNPISKLGLTFFFREGANGIEVELEYRTSLFDKEIIEQLCTDLLFLINAVVRQPEVQIDELVRELSDGATLKEQDQFSKQSIEILDENF